MNKDNSDTLVLKLAAAYDKEVPTSRLHAYREGLADLPDEAMDEIYREVSKTAKFFPTIAEICEAYGRLVAGDPTAEDDWAEILRVCTGNHDNPDGTWPAPEVSTLARETLEAIGGQYRVRNADQIGLAVLRKEFMEYYQAHHDHDKRTAQLGHDPRRPQIGRGGMTPVGELVGLPEKREES